MKAFIRHIRKARAAFTLMEVNLAIFIMAVGVLAMTSLYPLGFRESEQSRDDVRASVAADEVLGKLTAALSSRNITWQQWRSAVGAAVEKTPRGWFSYYDKRGDDEYVVKDISSVDQLADEVFATLAGAYDGPKLDFVFPGKNKYAYGLVAQWGKRIIATGPGKNQSVPDYSRVSISFRLSRRSGSLLTAPIYYTEIHVQGDQANGGAAQ